MARVRMMCMATCYPKSHAQDVEGGVAMRQAGPRSDIIGRSSSPQELSGIAVGDERSDLGLYCDEACGKGPD
jgi:hypothetical protein